MAFDDYKNKLSIGQGQMGVVFRADDLMLPRKVAIKLLRKEYAQDDEFVKRFQREAELFAKLDHPHILPIYSLEVENGSKPRLFFVTKYAERGSLATAIKEQTLTFTDQRNLIQHIGSALAYIHERGIIHRDVKPSNILIDSENRFLLGDFGIADVPDEKEALTREGVSIGTIRYMSPEQIQGKSIDARSDLYSFGIVCYEMFTGRLPFSGGDQLVILNHLNEPVPRPSTIKTEISPALDGVLLKSLAKDRENRYQTANEMVEAFLQALDNPEIDSIKEKITGELDNRQTGEVQAVVQAWRKGSISERDLKKMISLVTELLNDLENIGKPLRYHAEAKDIITGSWDIKQKFEVSLPIIPLLLNYSLEFEKGAELRNLWDKFVSKSFEKNVWLDKVVSNKYIRISLGAIIPLIILVSGVQYIQNWFNLPSPTPTVTSVVTLGPTSIPSTQITPSQQPSLLPTIDASAPSLTPEATLVPTVIPTVPPVSTNVVDVISYIDLSGKGDISSIAFSFKKQYIAAAHADRNIHIYTLEGEEVVILTGHTTSIDSLDFSSDSTRLVSAGGDQNIRLWDINSFNLIRAWQAHVGGTAFVGFFVDPLLNEILVTGGAEYDPSIRRWNPKTGDDIGGAFSGPSGAISSIDFSPTNTLLVSISYDTSTVFLWNTSRSNSAFSVKHPVSGIRSRFVKFSADESFFATGWSNGSVILWDSVTGDKLQELETPSNEISSISFSEDGRYLVAGAGDGNLYLWNLEDFSLLTSAKEHSTRILKIIFDGSNKFITGSEDGEIKIWVVNESQR